MKIGIMGVAGIMGRMIAKQVHQTANAALAGGTVLPGSAEEGIEIAKLCGFDAESPTTVSDAATVFAAADVVIDFTSPAATVAHAGLAAESGTAFVVGTTGLTAEDEARLAEAAKSIPLVYAPNMSLGVNLLFDLVKKVSAALDESFDIEIVEMHHRRKVDAPSGTALGLGKAAAEGRGVTLEEKGVLSREGVTGPREDGQIGFATLRGGDVVGDHTVIFAGPNERIELTHKAASREIFAAGAVKASLWAAGRKPGLYAMPDVLGL
ncbi:4-hydroxy-tetrahydrodipicolinate reductase [Nisaea acidiphila]|uniref:4-hydroxy-tetrahydrodipicolinate reductase n=1 Tax=Nisaea acidiphila TaxID=1862145 RepID=A0A9J7B3M9_9PROT|nr:4-hydroxy-tetrahydrodipicolinate reductase [Nisaea acidiphila]UUX52229.1 4-hydroxy-tetrahydrodipicolinate reductase [Nisaea acidiphila]